MRQIQKYNPTFTTIQPLPSQWTSRDVENLRQILQGYQYNSPAPPRTCPLPTGGTYFLVDPHTGEAMRIGRTSDLERRRQELERDPDLMGYKFQVDVRSDSYSQQRGREQILYERYSPPFNKINPISPSNPKRPGYLNSVRGLKD